MSMSFDLGETRVGDSCLDADGYVEAYHASTTSDALINMRKARR